jgi:hypothetical protein
MKGLTMDKFAETLRHAIRHANALDRLHQLAEQGITVSIVYGSCGNLGIMYNVDVLTSGGMSFGRPYACSSFETACSIAFVKCVEYGWW